MKTVTHDNMTRSYSKPTKNLNIGDKVDYLYNSSGIQLEIVGMTEKAYKTIPSVGGERSGYGLLQTVWIPKSVVLIETYTCPNVTRQYYVTKDTFYTKVHHNY